MNSGSVSTSDPALLLWLALATLLIACLACVLLIALLIRRQPDPEPGLRLLAQQLAGQISHQRESARELAESARDNRQEISSSVRDLARTLSGQLGQSADLHTRRADHLSGQFERLHELVDRQLDAIRTDNASRLEAMRRTVDEQLQTTLELKLGESFRLVSERLEQVQRGLGEMQHLAADVGDLKRVLSNVKTRGIWGEAQLAAILEQMFGASQYRANVEVVPGSGERVEFALALPGSPGRAPLWLPIDAKFPREDYERLMLAQEASDGAGAEAAGRRLETRVRAEARSIRSRYIVPPHSTDFGMMFVPVEGLYAELARRPGLLDDLQRDHRVILAGPSTLAAILSSVQMGLKTLAIEQRSGEIRRLLGAVKVEFARFGETLAATRQQLEKAAGTIGHAETRSRAISRQLSEVEMLPVSGSDDARAPEPAERHNSVRPGDPATTPQGPTPPDRLL